MHKLLILFLILFSCSKPSQGLDGFVVRIIDGDTFIFRAENKTFRVRMYGIDAPEISQPFGPRTKDYLKRYVEKRATLICHGKDKYNRVLATVYIGGIDLNKELVKNGYAWCFMCKDSSYFRLQREAKENHLGIWHGEPVEPWIYRKQNN